MRVAVFCGGETRSLEAVEKGVSPGVLADGQWPKGNVAIVNPIAWSSAYKRLLTWETEDLRSHSSPR